MYCSLERGLTNLTIFSFVLETKQMNIFVQEAKIFCVSYVCNPPMCGTMCIIVIVIASKQ